MKSVINQIDNLDKQTAKDFKFIAEQALGCTLKQIEDHGEAERICTILETIIVECKDRVKEISSKELEEEFLISNK